MTNDKPRCGDIRAPYICDRDQGHPPPCRGYNDEHDEPVFWDKIPPPPQRPTPEEVQQLMDWLAARPAVAERYLEYVMSGAGVTEAGIAEMRARIREFTGG